MQSVKYKHRETWEFSASLVLGSSLAVHLLVNKVFLKYVQCFVNINKTEVDWDTSVI